MSEARSKAVGSLSNGTETVTPMPVRRNERTFRSADIFAGTSEVVIEHGGEYYRLRSTRNGKLILTK